MTSKLYGHVVGEFNCDVVNCEGHRRSYQPSLHRISLTQTQGLQSSLPKAERSYHYHDGQRGRCCQVHN